MNNNIFYLLAVLVFIACNKPKRYCPTTVSGRLWNTATNLPITNAHVYIYETEFTGFLPNLNNKPRGYVGSTLTDENGNYTFTFEAVSNVKDLEYTVVVDRKEIGTFVSTIKDYATNPPTIINVNNYIPAKTFWIAAIQNRCKNNYAYFDRAIGNNIEGVFHNNFPTPNISDSVVLKITNDYFTYVSKIGIGTTHPNGSYIQNKYILVLTGNNTFVWEAYKNGSLYIYDTTIYIQSGVYYKLDFFY
jgi:hypothetical protein